MTDLYIGIMTGTSLDGADIVLVDFSNGEHKIIAFDTYQYPPDLRDAVLSVNQNQPTTIASVGEIDNRLGLFFTDVTLQFLEQFSIDAQSVRAIGCHGQTMWHQPTGQYLYTMQLGNASVLANKTQIDVVSDFRSADMVFGGQGAPFAPAYHQCIFSHDTERRAVVNVGGISNITVLIPNESVVGYDTGTGNLLMDAWVQKHLGENYDKDGAWAKSAGGVDMAFLDYLLSDPFFKQPAPKSTGREYFNTAWLEQKIISYGMDLSPEMVQSALVDLTAKSIVDETNQLQLDTLLVCGGGVHNGYLMERLSYYASCNVVSCSDYGVNPDSLEAVLFAWLAKQHVCRKPATITTVTGATQSTILGALSPYTKRQL